MDETFTSDFIDPRSQTNPNLKAAYRIAIQLLTKKDYSRFKLKEKLKNKGFTEETCDQALNQLVDEKLLNEQNYIEARVKGLARKGQSISMILRKLQQEEIHLENFHVAEILDDNHIDQDEIIRELIDKKTRQLGPMPIEYKKKMQYLAKIHRFLASKGHRSPDYLFSDHSDT
jgi:regulatory protein